MIYGIDEIDAGGFTPIRCMDGRIVARVSEPEDATLLCKLLNQYIANKGKP